MTIVETLGAPFHWFLRALAVPVHRAVFYNEATQKFAEAHPSLFALAILLGFYVIFGVALVLLHKAWIAIFGVPALEAVAKDFGDYKREKAKKMTGGNAGQKDD